jgi:hypothetical protein
MNDLHFQFKKPNIMGMDFLIIEIYFWKGFLAAFQECYNGYRNLDYDEIIETLLDFLKVRK